MPEMTGTRILEQDGGFVAVAELSDGTLSTPLSAPVREEPIEAEWDRPFVRMTDTGPVYDAPRVGDFFVDDCCGNCCDSNCGCF